jgi:hypothetical protein
MEKDNFEIPDSSSEVADVSKNRIGKAETAGYKDRVNFLKLFILKYKKSR